MGPSSPCLGAGGPARQSHQVNSQYSSYSQPTNEAVSRRSGYQGVQIGQCELAGARRGNVHDEVWGMQSILQEYYYCAGRCIDRCINLGVIHATTTFPPPPLKSACSGASPNQIRIGDEAQGNSEFGAPKLVSKLHVGLMGGGGSQDEFAFV